MGDHIGTWVARSAHRTRVCRPLGAGAHGSGRVEAPSRGHVVPQGFIPLITHSGSMKNCCMLSLASSARCGRHNCSADGLTSGIGGKAACSPADKAALAWVSACRLLKEREREREGGARSAASLSDLDPIADPMRPYGIALQEAVSWGNAVDRVSPWAPAHSEERVSAMMRVVYAFDICQAIEVLCAATLRPRVFSDARPSMTSQMFAERLPTVRHVQGMVV